MADFPDSTPMTEISRPVVEAEIELLIGLLDQLDEDPDVEDNADLELTGDEEPMHGAPEQQTGSWKGIEGSSYYAEGEELELGWTEMEARFGRYHGAGNDVYEPSLGSTNSMNQVQWSKGGADDREDEHDGREDCCEDDEDGNDGEGELGWTDLRARTGKYIPGPSWYVQDGEPSLASTSSLNQVHWSKGMNDDLEEQCEDEGAINSDREPDRDGEGTSNYNGPCSPFETLIGGLHAE